MKTSTRSSSHSTTLPAASEAYVERIKARLEAVDGECGVTLVDLCL